MEILTPEHERWVEFTERLEGPEGCNFQENPEWPGTGMWQCDASEDRPKARAILERMGGFDIEATLDFFSEYGGHCDCEILFNVEDGVERSKARRQLS
jgi:hypothetical protein